MQGFSQQGHRATRSRTVTQVEGGVHSCFLDGHSQQKGRSWVVSNPRNLWVQNPLREVLENSRKFVKTPAPGDIGSLWTPLRWRQQGSERVSQAPGSHSSRRQPFPPARPARSCGFLCC